MSSLAILQMADEPQIRSSAHMLQHAGYDEIKVCGPDLRNHLQRIGCDTVLAVSSMTALGYDRLPPWFQEATVKDLDRCDLFCEIKVRNVPKIIAAHPRLKNRIAWWRVNGAQPEICPRGGDEVHLPCPVITACLWYRLDPTRMEDLRATISDGRYGGTIPPMTSYPDAPAGRDWGGMAYTCWPPYPGEGEYLSIDRSSLATYDAPYCLCHSVRAWGYGEIVSQVRDLGVRCFGNNSPDGQISHREVPRIASTAMALVHLKSVDCPGWALYEAMLAGCPVVVGRLLNSRMLAYELLHDGHTCYEFGVPALEEFGRGPLEPERCLAEIGAALERLRDPVVNRAIGESGRRRLRELMWSDERRSDVESFRAFMVRHFP